MKKKQKYHSFYKWYFRITSLLIVLALLSLVTKEKDDCDELGKDALKFYGNVLEPSIKNMNKSDEHKVFAIGLLNKYLNMSRNYFLCVEENYFYPNLNPE